jgi:hypothetical protein
MKRLAALIVVFFAGMTFDQVMLHWQKTEQKIEDKAYIASAGAERVDQQSYLSSSSTFPKINIKDKPVKITADGSQESETHDFMAKKTNRPIVTSPNSDIESELYNKIRDPFPAKKLINQSPKSDGTFATQEVSENGDPIFKSYNAEGVLIGEQWKQASGAEVTRSFYDDSGAIKGFSIKDSDGSTTMITFTQSGLFKDRLDVLPDGTKVATAFDDSGQVIEKWRIDNKGKGTKIF